MTFETPPSHKLTEVPAHHEAGTVGPYDILQLYGGMHQPKELGHSASIVDRSGNVVFPPIFPPGHDKSTPQDKPGHQEGHKEAHQPGHKEVHKEIHKEAHQPGHEGGHKEVHKEARKEAHQPGLQGAQEKAQKEGHGAASEHLVKGGDSLWKIAQESLSHGQKDSHATTQQIRQRVDSIVHANQDKYPGLATNPNLIHQGDKLIVPTEDHPQHNGAVERNSHGTSQKHPNHGALPIEKDSGRDSAGHQTSRDDGGRLVHGITGLVNGFFHGLGHALSGEASQQARKIHTVGDCARGPRQTLEQFGIKLQHMTAVAQGRVMEASGLFDRVAPGSVQPGDYGYRHWSASTINRKGVGDKGDSFIVTGASKGTLQAANDHCFQVPPGGGYYAPGITFLRPNAKFYQAYENYKATGKMTYL